ncbi:hypothetical protein KKG66_09375 [bacterium]|nr:hypothetical protein [bacterium]
MKHFSFILLGLMLILGLSNSSVYAELREHEVTGYVSIHELKLLGSPEVIYDAMTGEIGGWWDHNFSGHPVSFRIEPKPGGGFYEIFDETGNGVKHGTVIYADRGKRLTFEGPLGLNGLALHLVATYNYTAEGDSTLLNVTINYSGQISKENAGVIDQVWHHFLFDGLKPYIEAGKHLE